MTINDIWVVKVFDGKTVSAGESEDSDVIDLGAKAWNGNFALQIYCTGAGASVDAKILQSNDKVHFVIPNGVSAICSGYPGAADEDYEIYTASPSPARFLKIRATEVTGAAATLTAWLSIG